jgi:hypothetical protein
MVWVAQKLRRDWLEKLIRLGGTGVSPVHDEGAQCAPYTAGETPTPRTFYHLGVGESPIKEPLILVPKLPLGNGLVSKALLCFLVTWVTAVDLKERGVESKRGYDCALRTMTLGRLLSAIKVASPLARPYTGQAELGGQVRSQAGAWERGKIRLSGTGVSPVRN